MSFAANLKNAMDERRMSQTELSALAGIGKSSISQYLSGKNVPKGTVLEKLAEALETSVGFLLEEADVTDSVRGTPMKNVPISLAAAMLGKGEQFVRVSLQRGTAPFGFAVKVTGTRYSYHISAKKLNEYLGTAK
ncbi:MAG: helix-turn-helix domain-containing protein [Eubacteriales bacterium]|nr:helix-turn-helix domain-containing protein [Eubacteriales bacterium]